MHLAWGSVVEFQGSHGSGRGRCLEGSLLQRREVGQGQLPALALLASADVQSKDFPRISGLDTTIRGLVCFLVRSLSPGFSVW